jgi:hypothetical protein
MSDLDFLELFAIGRVKKYPLQLQLHFYFADYIRHYGNDKVTVKAL